MSEYTPLNKSKKARIAFVGAGEHATESLYPNIPLIPEFELIAVCDLIADKAQYHASKYGAQWFSDFEKMIDTVQPQGLCICGPPEMHYQLGIEALRRGIPIFIEKPPGLTFKQAQELVDVARENNVWGMVGFMKRFAPANLVAKEFMSNPEFGNLSSISLIHGSGPYENIRRMLIFSGIHMLDLGRFMAGEIKELFAYTYDAGNNIQAVSVAIQFASGVVGQLNMNSGHNWLDCFEMAYLSGTGSAIVIENSRSTEIMSPSRRFAQGKGMQLFGWSSRYYVSGNMAGWAAGGHYIRGYWGELNHFAQAILGEVRPTPSLEDGAMNMRVIEAILDSIELGRHIEISRNELN